MSSPRVDRGHNFFQEYPNEWSSFWTVRWTFGSVSGEGPSSYARQTTCWKCFGVRHRRGIFFSLARIPWHLLFQKSSWILPYWWSLSLKFLFGLRRSWRSQVFVINGLITSCFERVLSCSRKGKRFVILIFIFMHVLSMSRICWFSLWHGKDYMLLWVTCTITRFVVGWYVRLVRSNTICPIVEYSAGEENRPKAGHVILCPWGSSSIVVPRFLIWGSENKIGTSLVSSTSPMVAHGGVVGKWTMQLSKQVSVSEFANTKGFVATAKFCLDTMIPCMFLKSFDCWSRSNRSCAAQIQNPVCRMVGKIQRGYRHPSSMSSRAVPSCSSSPRIIRPLTGRPVIRFPGMVSFFNSCFRGWKFGLRMSFFFNFSFLELSLRLHLDGKGESHPSESHHCLLRCAFLFFFLFSFFLFPFFLFSFFPFFLFSFFPFFLFSLFPFFLAALVWSGLPDTLSVVPCPETWSFIINAALLASHPWPLSKVVFSIFFYNEGSLDKHNMPRLGDVMVPPPQINKFWFDRKPQAAADEPLYRFHQRYSGRSGRSKLKRWALGFQQSGVGPSSCSSVLGSLQFFDRGRRCLGCSLEPWTSFLEPLSDSSSCGVYASVSEALDAFTVLAGRAWQRIFIYSSSACWRLWKNFIFLYVVWQIRILKSASLFLWPCSSSNGGGMHSAGYACFGALRAMFLSCRQKWPCSSSTMAVECILLVLLVFMHLAPCPWRLPAEVPRSLSTLAVVFSHFALRSRRLPAGVSMCSLLCTSWFMAWWKLWRSRSCCSPWVVQFLDKVVDVPVVFTTGAVFRHGCWYARCVQRHGSWSRQQFLDKVVAVPVVFTTGAHGSRRAENVWRCRRCSSALLGTSLWPCSAFCGVYGDGAVQVFFSPYMNGFLRPPLRSWGPANSSWGAVDIHTRSYVTEQQQ